MVKKKPKKEEKELTLKQILEVLVKRIRDEKNLQDETDTISDVNLDLSTAPQQVEVEGIPKYEPRPATRGEILETGVTRDETPVDEERINLMPDYTAPSLMRRPSSDALTDAAEQYLRSQNIDLYGEVTPEARERLTNFLRREFDSGMSTDRIEGLIDTIRYEQGVHSDVIDSGFNVSVRGRIEEEQKLKEKEFKEKKYFTEVRR